MTATKLLRTSMSVLWRPRQVRTSAVTYSICNLATRRAVHSSSKPLWAVVPRRPKLQTQQLRGGISGGADSRRTIFIQTEPTPNSDALKFLPNHRVLPEDISTPFIEYLNPRSTIAPPYPSPLAAQLMNIDGVQSVFYGADFITVTKASDANWAHIRPEIFSLITEAITSGQKIVNIVERTDASGEDGQETSGEVDSLSYNENDSEVVGMIKELLETRIRPAIQEDGGDIEFRGFEDGNVLLKLRGACRTCDSSTVTLKNGIEGMLMHYIEEVQGVIQVMDPEEEIAAKEFAKFEEKLRAQKGEAPPSTVGKGSLDTVSG
ncbi:HIRA-interacting protein 5 [Pyricularia oryzae 70-15]|uniref:HIRA-interacting protein 5 n=1 Tax=Pyricularia oryzae (strain 70-15 / ATCC MYA-4617 / FGSC 8958) TaxID=242507 RepID=G4MNX6_PYRO7|nr:HIRA-interacting protein 5 [Pyricularia oryzae 70-15]EHA57133.1 HIRA-interacting protein 5 [Pyricularia oryzae 70-15]KAI7920323.1 HIRA-interacting protein 5 [Pyricularia oryzae]KAI7927397.1 HIRA-interacting protein 5 [Pyricularia oryzae]